jgi:[ribosomal protein S18]-alanine N-acetyltransferase
VSLRLAPIGAEQAAAVAAWRYPPPFDVYDSTPGDSSHMLQPELGYHAVTDGDELIGYCCFGADARVPGGDYDEPALDIGWGMRPDLMGRGGGVAFVGAILAHAEAMCSPAVMRVTIAAFNGRSRRVAERAGFRESGRFVARAGPEFAVLVRR